MLLENYVLINCNTIKVMISFLVSLLKKNENIDNRNEWLDLKFLSFDEVKFFLVEQQCSTNLFIFILNFLVDRSVDIYFLSTCSTIYICVSGV